MRTLYYQKSWQTDSETDYQTNNSALDNRFGRQNGLLKLLPTLVVSNGHLEQLIASLRVRSSPLKDVSGKSRLDTLGNYAGECPI